MRECESCKYSKMSAHDSLCWLCWAGDMWEPEAVTAEQSRKAVQNDQTDMRDMYLCILAYCGHAYNDNES